MARTYTKSRRAENEAETRQRIIDAAVSLHEQIGPSATTISMIAERAGVQRHTVYAHFADEMSLYMACSGSHLTQNPLPAPESWASLAAGEQRLVAALTEIYRWFDANEAMTAAVLRDAERNDTLREVMGKRFGVPFAAYREALSPGLGSKGKAALALALSFHNWRTLQRDMGMKLKDAVALMAGTVLNADSHK